MAVLVLVAAPALATRFEFKIVGPNETPIQGAKVCIFAGAAATPLQQWFSSSGDARCHSSETIIAFPPGEWNVFAVKEGEYASRHPYHFPITHHPANTDTGYKRIIVDVVPAATVTIAPAAIAADVAPVLYFPGTRETLPFAIPFAKDERTLTIPAGMDFVPFFIAHGDIAGVGSLHRGIAPGGRATLAASDATGRALVTFFRVARIPPSLTGPYVHDLPSPVVAFVGSTGATYAVLNRTPVRDGELVIFRSLSDADRYGTITVAGGTWEREETPVTLQPATRTTVAAPLAIVPAAQVTILTSPAEMEWLRNLLSTDCVPAANLEAGRSEPVIEISGCSNTPCDRQRSAPLAEFAEHGSVTFDSLPVGEYTVRIKTARPRPLWSRAVTVPTGKANVQVAANLAALSGVVRSAGAPASARLSIGDGTATTDTDGRYHVRFTTPPPPDRILVRECRTATDFVIFPQRPIEAETTFDIDLPGPLTIRVNDDRTNRPIAGATVDINVADPDDPRQLLHSQRIGSTDAAGEVVAHGLPIARFHLCAEHRDYARRCVSVPTAPPAVIALTRNDVQAGKLAGLASVDLGMLFFVTQDGAVVESVRVDGSGAFSYRYPHGTDEFLIFVSRSHPLSVLRVPLDRAEVTIPARPVRTFRVTTTTEDVFDVGLMVGGVVIPAAALSRHQGFRALGTQTRRGELQIREVSESGPIVIYRGFGLRDRPPALSPALDLFAMPEYRATFPRATLTAAGVVRLR